jgi:hypothetical protein
LLIDTKPAVYPEFIELIWRGEARLRSAGLRRGKEGAMTSFRKVWLPAILCILFIFYVPFCSGHQKEMPSAKIIVEKIIPPTTEVSRVIKNQEHTFVGWSDFWYKDTLSVQKQKRRHKLTKIIGSQKVALNEYPDISLREAFLFAKNAFKETGIRPEYLFAFYTQETSQGKNLGTCFLFNPNIFGPGVGVDLRSGKFSSRIMKPERDIEPFFTTMNELGRDPYVTPVSCPMKNIGWGGGMGYMQFIPSTWISVKDRVAIALEKDIADPWNIEDALMAAAFHLKDCGADGGKASSEREAACRYFSGKPCGEKKVVHIKKKNKKTKHRVVYVENPIIARYGNSIVRLTKYFHKILNPDQVVAKTNTRSEKKHTARKKTRSYSARKKKTRI